MAAAKPKKPTPFKITDKKVKAIVDALEEEDGHMLMNEVLTKYLPASLAETMERITKIKTEKALEEIEKLQAKKLAAIKEDQEKLLKRFAIETE